MKKKAEILLFAFLLSFARNGKSAATDAPEIRKAETSYRVRLNETICLPCKAKKQYIDPFREILFYWSKEGSPVMQWPRYRIKQNRCLRIRHIRSSDHGDFVCVAMSKQGEARAIRKLIVIDRDKNATTQVHTRPIGAPRSTIYPAPPPWFTGGTLKRTAVILRKSFYIGRKAKLRCAVKGSPRPQIKWWLNGKLLGVNTPLISLRPKVFGLVIQTFSPVYAGNYTCVATNSKGSVNMSIIANLKAGNPNQVPPAEESVLCVKEGDNITLHCKAPANRVKLLHWRTPRKSSMRNMMKEQQQRPNDINPAMLKKLREEPNVVNGTRINDFIMLNISKKIYAGKYECFALYKKSKTPYPIKIVHLQFQGDMTMVKEKNSQNMLSLPVKIIVPVFACFLTMVIVLICCRCRQKQIKLPSDGGEIPINEKHDDEDTLSLQILPAQPTGSLTIHRKSTESNNSETDHPLLSDHLYESVDPDLNEGTPVDGALCVQCRESSNNTSSRVTPNVECMQTNVGASTHKDNSKDTRDCCKTEASTANTWPGIKLLPGDVDYVSFSDDDRLLLRSNSCRTSNNNDLNDKRRRKKRKRSDTTDTKSYVTQNFHSGVVDDDIPPLEILELPEDEDHLLQREMKNWETLIESSASYSSDNRKVLSETCHGVSNCSHCSVQMII